MVLFIAVRHRHRIVQMRARGMHWGAIVLLCHAPAIAIHSRNIFHPSVNGINYRRFVTTIFPQLKWYCNSFANVCAQQQTIFEIIGVSFERQFFRTFSSCFNLFSEFPPKPHMKSQTSCDGRLRTVSNFPVARIAFVRMFVCSSHGSCVCMCVAQRKAITVDCACGH